MPQLHLYIIIILVIEGINMQKSNDSVESSTRMIRTIIENAEDILRSLPEDSEECLPVWWTNKLAISSAYIDSLRDYLVFNNKDDKDVEEADEEDSESNSEEEDDNYYDDYSMLPPSVRMVRNAT